MTKQTMTETTLQPEQPTEPELEPAAVLCDEALNSRQRQRYLVSLITEEGQQSDNRYREQ
jgi:hypothetical protein